MKKAAKVFEEEQSYARSYMLGQRKSVIVKRFAVENSIDDRILELQKQKRMLYKAVLNSESTKN
jgi:SNF2 family DNA or RNA helicase